MKSAPLPLPPGRLGLPWIGETLSFLHDNATFARERQRDHGSIFKSHLFGQPTVLMGGPEAMRFVFANEKDRLVSAWPKSTVALLGEGSLAVQEGESHLRLRKILSGVFGHKQLTTHVPQMDRIAALHLERWARRGTLTWCPLLSSFTFHIACALVLGDESDIAGFEEPFEAWLAGLFSLPIDLPFTVFGRALHARERLLTRIRAIAAERRTGGGTGEDALSVLVRAPDERGDAIEPETVVDMILTLLFAGHETSSSGLSSFCLLVAQHPEVLARLREEQSRLAFEGPLTVDRIKQMPYLDQVIKEVLRFMPPVAGGFRKVTAECEIGGYRIPAGWTVLYGINTTHRIAANFVDPDRFDPDRFGPDRAEDKQARFSFAPFGGGARVCIGMEYARLEMAVLGARLVRDYAWDLTPGQDLTIAPIPSPRPKSGLQVRFWRR
jgi:retinoid hydroxylase